MSAPRRVIESMNRPYSAALLDAAVERQARGAASDLPTSSGPQVSFAEPFREAHLESVTTRSAPSTVRAWALERLGAHLAADENFGRKLSNDAARALNGVDYLTDRERHILAGADKRVWAQLADASDKFHVASGKKGVAGVPSGPSSIGDYLNGFKFGSGGGGPADWQNASTPGRGGITLGSGVKVPGSAGGGPSGGSGSRGGDDGGRSAGGGPFGPANPFGARGSASVGSSVGPGGDASVPYDQQHYDPKLGKPPKAPVYDPRRPGEWERDLAVYEVRREAFEKGWGVGGRGWSTARGRAMIETIRQAGAAAAEGIERASDANSAVAEAGRYLTGDEPGESGGESSGTASGTEGVGAALAVPPPPPPPKPEGGRPNDFDPHGPGPAGPWSRDSSAARLQAGNTAIVPNDFDPRGPGPAGPWSLGTSRGTYLFGGLEAVPNDFDPRGPGPAGPWSRRILREGYGNNGDDVMPDPDDAHGGGPVGPAT